MSDTTRRRHRLDDAGHRLLLADRTAAIRRLLGATRPGRVLDVGCGAGDSLATFLAAVGPCAATGVDLDAARLAAARDRIRPGTFREADAGALPFGDATFDAVLLFTVLSSVPDDVDRRRIAAEALRVLGSGSGSGGGGGGGGGGGEGGGVLLYDFALNPLNRQTRGLSPREARILFPGCTFREERVTPLPALARRLARTGRPRTWLTRLPVPRTHHLTWITRP